MEKEAYLARYRTADEIRHSGAIGSLNEGAVIDLHGLHTRLVAWPGNGFQSESVHVLTLEPGQKSNEYAYYGSEEAMICLDGEAEVVLHERWVNMLPGDIAYFPEGTRRVIRNRSKERPLSLVSQITPPPVELYAGSGLYNEALGTMNFEACYRAALNASSGDLCAPLALAYRETEEDVRSWNLEAAEVRERGALFNMFTGAPFDALGIPARLVVWPGAGPRSAGFNLAYSPNPEADFIHTHPISDECLFLWSGKGRGFLGGATWLEMDTLECLLAPCGVIHGHWGEKTLWGGFASPPQPDLLVKTPYYQVGAISAAKSQRLELE
ncbi:MAG: cupin domain-containing protein [Puniceicoccales bacterium]